jgi:2-iminobutanoate/2-iminopropanoate deaminase
MFANEHESIFKNETFETRRKGVSRGICRKFLLNSSGYSVFQGIGLSCSFVLSALISENQRQIFSRRKFMSGFTRDVVSTPNAPSAIGPYSQAIKANGFVFISGQVAIDPATGNLISGGIEEQTERVLKNLSAILLAAGSSWEKVVKTTVFLKNMTEFGQMNEVYGKVCKNAPPARSTVEVARLPKDVSVEIDVIALA